MPLRRKSADTTSYPAPSTIDYQGGTPLIHYKFNESSGNLIDYGSVANDLAVVAGTITREIAGPGGNILLGSSNNQATPTTGTFFLDDTAASADVGTNDFTVVMWAQLFTPYPAGVAAQGWWFLLLSGAGNMWVYVDVTTFVTTVHLSCEGHVYECTLAKADFYDVLVTGPKKIVMQFDRSELKPTVIVDSTPIAVTSTSGNLSDLAAYTCVTTYRTMLGYDNASYLMWGAMWEFWYSTGLTYT